MTRPARILVALEVRRKRPKTVLLTTRVLPFQLALAEEESLGAHAEADVAKEFPGCKRESAMNHVFFLAFVALI